MKRTNATEILNHRYVGGDPDVAGDPDREASIREERINAAIAQRVYDLRTDAGLTQAQLARRAGMPRSAIRRLEDADAPDHSPDLLQRITRAVQQQPDSSTRQ